MSRPNFIFIIADDLGYADLGCNGAHGPSVSPNLDRMAAEGLRFTDGYANSPVCSPTRFAAITGRWQYRLRGAAEEPLSGHARGDKVLGLPPEHPTLPSLLRDAGYRTALVGKCHLGYPPHFGPLKSGYQSFFGPRSGGVDYFAYTDSSGKRDLWEGDEEAGDVGYLTDALSERAVRFVESAPADQPFFMSLHYTAPHWPWETRDDAPESKRIAGQIKHLDGGSVATYRRMIHHMDEGIGRVLDALKARGIDDNTLVVFTSDNGGERFSDVWPFVGGKMDLMEGGIRVPLIARWPARIAAGSTTATPALTMDWAPTMLAAAGVAQHADYPMDGADLRPLFADPSWNPGRPLYWRMLYREQRALRDGAWKYLKVDGHEYLFDLSRDARERANLHKREPQRLAQMRETWEAWARQMPGIPPDARVSLVVSEADMPRSTH